MMTKQKPEEISRAKNRSGEGGIRTHKTAFYTVDGLASHCNSRYATSPSIFILPQKSI